MVELLLLAGFFYVTRDSWAALMKSARENKGAGGNEVSWWGREAAHGFPHFRHPLAAGWRANQASAAQLRNDRLASRPDHIRRMDELKDLASQHRQNIRDARQPASQRTGGRRHSQPAARLTLVDYPPDSQPADTGWPGGKPPPPTEPCEHCGRKWLHLTGCPNAQPPGTHPGAGAPVTTTKEGCPRCGCPAS